MYLRLNEMYTKLYICLIIIIVNNMNNNIHLINYSIIYLCMVCNLLMPNSLYLYVLYYLIV